MSLENEIELGTVNTSKVDEQTTTGIECNENDDTETKGIQFWIIKVCRLLFQLISSISLIWITGTYPIIGGTITILSQTITLLLSVKHSLNVWKNTSKFYQQLSIIEDISYRAQVVERCKFIIAILFTAASAFSFDVSESISIIIDNNQEKILFGSLLSSVMPLEDIIKNGQAKLQEKCRSSVDKKNKPPKKNSNRKNKLSKFKQKKLEEAGINADKYQKLEHEMKTILVESFLGFMTALGQQYNAFVNGNYISFGFFAVGAGLFAFMLFNPRKHCT